MKHHPFFHYCARQFLHHQTRNWEKKFRMQDEMIFIFHSSSSSSPSSFSSIPTQRVNAKRNSLKFTIPFLSQSISSAKIKWVKQVQPLIHWCSNQIQMERAKGQWVLPNLLIAIRPEERSPDVVSFIADTISLLLTYPSLFLSKNTNASTNDSNVCSNFGIPNWDFCWSQGIQKEKHREKEWRNKQLENKTFGYRKYSIGIILEKIDKAEKYNEFIELHSHSCTNITSIKEIIDFLLCKQNLQPVKAFFKLPTINYPIQILIYKEAITSKYHHQDHHYIVGY